MWCTGVTEDTIEKRMLESFEMWWCYRKCSRFRGVTEWYNRRTSLRNKLWLCQTSKIVGLDRLLKLKTGEDMRMKSKRLRVWVLTENHRQLQPTNRTIEDQKTKKKNNTTSNWILIENTNRTPYVMLYCKSNNRLQKSFYSCVLNMKLTIGNHKNRKHIFFFGSYM